MASVVLFGPGLSFLLLHLLSRCFNFQFIFLKIKSSPSPGDVRELVLCFFLPFEHHLLSALDEKIFLLMVAVEDPAASFMIHFCLMGSSSFVGIRGF